MYIIFCTIGDITSSLYETNQNFYDITPTIFDIVSTLFLSPHPLYWLYHTNSIYEISSSIYVDIISIVFYTTTYSLCLYHQSHCTCVSHPHFPWYHTFFIFDFAPTICLISDTIHKISHQQFTTSRHITYDITGVVSMSSLRRYLTLHPEYLSPHIHSKCDLWTTVCMTSHPIYLWNFMHHT